MQKRVESIENIQDDVIDSLAEIRKFLCDSRTFSELTLEGSLHASNEAPSISIHKSGSFSKTKNAYSPSFKESKSVKECDSNKLSPSVPISENTEKQFDSKNKESALDSDKQDSGLDSDCREIHDHLSVSKPSISWAKPDSGDELLQLLDEISQKTEVLQQQLAVIDQKSCLDDDSPSDYSPMPTKKLEKKLSLAQQEGSLRATASCLNCSKLPQVAGAFMEENMPRKNLSNESPEHFDSKSFSERVHKMQKRSTNKIDSAMVSSILKETNVVDLQRQVLIYLVENAVLHTKLGELEQLLSCKTIESNKVENSLKEETRLLMMENRELRISLDEQKLETNSLRSKVLMLERVLQSISVENRELTWQLGESLGIQNLSRKEPRKISSSYTYGNPSSNPKITRRPSLPSQFACQTDTAINCVKSKLLSNASSFLDVTVEEPEQWSEIQTPAAGFDNHGGPMHASTPFTKLKDVKNSVNSPSSSPSNFQSVKKRFKTTEKDSLLFKSRNLEKHLDEVPHETHADTCMKNVKYSASNFEDSAAKFPFNSILEKLKANSDYRLSKRTSLTQTSDVNFSGDHKPVPFSKGRLTACEDEESASPENIIRQNIQSKNFQSRRGKNIHQRIQDILDRIMSESEEAT